MFSRDYFLLVPHLTPLLRSLLHMCSDSMAMVPFVMRRELMSPASFGAFWRWTDILIKIFEQGMRQLEMLCRFGGGHIRALFWEGAYALCSHPSLFWPLESGSVPWRCYLHINVLVIPWSLPCPPLVDVALMTDSSGKSSHLLSSETFINPLGTAGDLAIVAVFREELCACSAQTQFF